MADERGGADLGEHVRDAGVGHIEDRAWAQARTQVCVQVIADPGPQRFGGCDEQLVERSVLTADDEIFRRRQARGGVGREPFAVAI